MGRNGWTQSSSDEYVAGLLNKVKAQMVFAAEENKKLVKENKALMVQLISLQLEVEKREKERELALKSIHATTPLLLIETPMPAQWEDVQNDALNQEARDIYLSGRSMNLDAAQRLRELKLYDLQYERQELQLDFKVKELLLTQKNEKKHPDFDTIKKDIEKSVAEEMVLRDKIAHAEKEAMEYSGQVEMLKKENTALRKKIKRLKGYVLR